MCFSVRGTFNLYYLPLFISTSCEHHNINTGFYTLSVVWEYGTKSTHAFQNHWGFSSRTVLPDFEIYWCVWCSHKNKKYTAAGITSSVLRVWTCHQGPLHQAMVYFCHTLYLPSSITVWSSTATIGHHATGCGHPFPPKLMLAFGGPTHIGFYLRTAASEVLKSLRHSASGSTSRHRIGYTHGYVRKRQDYRKPVRFVELPARTERKAIAVNLPMEGGLRDYQSNPPGPFLISTFLGLCFCVFLSRQRRSRFDNGCRVRDLLFILLTSLFFSSMLFLILSCSEHPVRGLINGVAFLHAGTQPAYWRDGFPNVLRAATLIHVLPNLPDNRWPTWSAPRSIHRIQNQPLNVNYWEDALQQVINVLLYTSMTKPTSPRISPLKAWLNSCTALQISDNLIPLPRHLSASSTAASISPIFDIGIFSALFTSPS